MELNPSDNARFWAKVEKTDYCWNWTSQLRSGYGLFRLNGKIVSAHRLSYQIHRGDPAGRQVRHTCDNPKCVNPDHLLLGNAKANSDDKMYRDRHGFKLSNAQVMDMRARPTTFTMCRDFAKEFGVSSYEVKKAITGETYGWLDGAKDIPPQFTGWALSLDEVVEIMNQLQDYKWGMVSKLAKHYGVSVGTISHIKRMRLDYAQLIHKNL